MTEEHETAAGTGGRRQLTPPRLAAEHRPDPNELREQRQLAIKRVPWNRSRRS